MITKIQGEAPFQVLTNNFSISPSQEGYTLQISADGVNYSNLFSVGANVTRLVTGVAANSYYRLLGNASEVSINWMKTCVTEGGGGSTYTAGDYISIDQDIISVTGITPDLYLTTADTQDFATEAYVDAAITSATQDFATEADITAATSPIEEHLNDVEYVTATALTELHNDVLGISGSTYTKSQVDAAITGATANLMTSAATQVMIEEATSGITEDLDEVIDMMQTKEEVVSRALNDLHNDILDLSGATPTNSPIIPAITSQAEYGAISGDVKTGDLIQVQNVDLDGDNEPEYGLFEANVQEEEDQGVIRKLIYWTRRDNGDSVYWSYEDYPWMLDIDVNPIELNPNGFIISPDTIAEDEAYNGIGFNVDGKPVTTHIVPQYDEQTGEITGITREDRDILGELDEVAADVNEAFSAITETQQVAAAGLNSLESQIINLSGNTYTKAEVDAEITGATSDMKTYTDNRIDGYNTASTITITSTPMTEGYWLYFGDGADVSAAYGPDFQMFKTSKANLVVADISGLNSYTYMQSGEGVTLIGYDSAQDAYDTQMAINIPSSVSLTPQNYNMDIPFIVSTTRPSTRVILEWDNLSTSGYPNYFIYNTDTMVGHFAYDLNINEFVPGVVKSDGVITKVKKLTQAEYDAITTPDASTLYIIINN